MGDAPALHYPEPSHCVQCGRELDPGQLECPFCYPEAAEPASPGREATETWLRRSRGRLLLGIAFFGWILPWAYLASRKAETLYLEGGLDDPKLLWRIRFHAFLAVAAFLLWAIAWIGLLMQR